MMTWIRYTIFRTYESDRPVIANTHDFFFLRGWYIYLCSIQEASGLNVNYLQVFFYLQCFFYFLLFLKKIIIVF